MNGEIGATKCRMISIGDAEEITVALKAPRLEAVGSPALCNQQDKFIWSVGGYDAQSNPSDHVARYIIKEDQWNTNVPTLLNKRAKAGTCTLGYNLYVFGGTNEDGIFVDMIEKLTLVQYGLPKAGW